MVGRNYGVSGILLKPLAVPNSSDALSKIAQRSLKVGACLVRQGATNGNGYGRIWHGGKRYYTHRLAYESAKGPIPPKFDIDHLCRNHSCCNPEHLEAVTRRENAIRGIGPSLLKSRMAAVTHCPKGHQYTSENTMIRDRGKYTARACRECHRAAFRNWWHKTRAKPEP